MAATYDLDVSLALDDLGWHFATWHHQPLAEETQRGLDALHAHEAAQLFSAAYALVLPHWHTIGRLLIHDVADFIVWYAGSELEKALEPLNRQMWTLRDSRGYWGLMSYWLPYARAYPYNLVHISQ